MSKYMPKFYTLEDMTQEDLNKLALERNTFASEIERLNNIIKEVREEMENAKHISIDDSKAIIEHERKILKILDEMKGD